MVGPLLGKALKCTCEGKMSMKRKCELSVWPATAIMKDVRMLRLSWTGRVTGAISCALALWALVPCPHAMAQTTSKQLPLRSFCGFNAGDDESKCKTGPRTNKALAETFVRARTPFRRFKDVQLKFQDGKLTGVSAYACIDYLKPPVAKKELEYCCKELTNLGIMFPSDWSVEGSKYKKEGTGEGVSVQLQGDVESTRYVSAGNNNKAVKCAEFSIDVDWSSSAVQSINQQTKSISNKKSAAQEKSKQTEDKMDVLYINEKGQPIVGKSVLGLVYVTGTEEQVREQEERIKKRMEELERKEATTPKIVQKPGRFPITIIGSEDFIKRTENALALIQEKSPRSYAIVTNYLSVIQSAQRSGIDPCADIPTFAVGPLIAGRSAMGYASAIVHDSCHSKLYREYRKEHKNKPVSADVYSGRKGEDKCIDAELDFLRDAKASEAMIRSHAVAKHRDYFTIERTW